MANTAASAAPIKPSACVIFLHGTGGNGDEFNQLFAPVRRALPWVEFVCPTAAERAYTLFGGERLAVWFDRGVLGLKCKEDRAGISASVQLVDQLLAERAVKPHGIGRSRTIVGGFSQGGALALYAAFGVQNPQPFAGCMTVGAFLPDPTMLIDSKPATTVSVAAADKSEVEAGSANPAAVSGSPAAAATAADLSSSSTSIPDRLRCTPLLMLHGTHDGVVPLRNGLSTCERLQAQARLSSLTFVQRKGMDHEVDDNTTRHLVDFIQKILPQQ